MDAKISPNNFVKQLYLSAHYIYSHFVQAANETWYLGRTTIAPTRYQIQLVCCAKCLSSER